MAHIVIIVHIVYPLYPGDRVSLCKGLMKPVSYRYNSKKGYQIMHRCEKCSKEQWNIIAENTVQEDDFIGWLKLCGVAYR